MKNLFLVCTVLLTTLTLAQNSAHSKNTVFGSGYDQWSLGKEKNEMYLTLQKSVGYMNTYNELIKILKFYDLKMEDVVVDDSTLDVKIAIDDFNNMSKECELENVNIFKVWFTKEYEIIWDCHKKNNGIIVQLRANGWFKSVSENKSEK